LTEHGEAGYLFSTVKSHVSILQCDGYAYEGVVKAVRGAVDLLGGMDRFVKPGQRVLLKPNFLIASTVEKGVTTHPMMAKAVLELVREAGGIPSLGDSPAFGTAQRVAAKCGISSVTEDMNCPIVDFRETVEVQTPDGFTFRKFDLARDVRDADLVINLPKIKTHGQMLLTLGVKNMFGCIPGTRKMGWHLKAGIDRVYFGRMLLELYATIKPGLTIMDGIMAMEGNGPSGGQMRPLNMVMAGTDCVSIDSTVTHLLGLPRERLWTTRVAVETGLGKADPEDIEVLGVPLETLKVEGFRLPEASDVAWGLPGFLQGLLKDAVLPKPIIDRGRCQECLHCVQVCPPKAMEEGDKGILTDGAKCIRCFCCQEVCPEGAIDIRAGFLSRMLGRGKETRGR
jgi:uncharacterized protein (DUF362 family)/Pyruvate/2-oxoacid:ferredoxin oxidoreductase delta subunit